MVFAIIACVEMVFVMMVDYEWFKAHAASYGLTIALLAAVVDGARANHSRIALDLGPFNFQPAEMAKFTC